jgi:hypothetical protein
MTAIPLRWALAAWLVVLTAVCIRVVYQGGRNSVVPVFLEGGRNWAAGAPIYGEPKPGLDHFRYSPAVAAYFAPWSLLPPWAAEVACRTVALAAFIGGIAVWSRWWWGGRSHLAAVLLLVAPLAVGNVNNGQFNPLIAGLACAAVGAFAGERWLWAAVAVTVATLLKGYPLSLGLLLTVIEPRRFGVPLGAVLAAGLALPFLCQEPSYVAEQYAACAERNSTYDRTQIGPNQGYRDFQMLMGTLGAPIDLSTYRVIEVIAGAGCALAVWAVNRRAGRRAAVWACGALAACWMTLFGPATESPTYVLAALTLAQLVVDASERSTLQRCLAYMAFALFAASMTTVWFPRWFHTRAQALGIQPAAALLLLLGVVVECRRLVRARPAAGDVPFPAARAA